jgi:hypothetical protein
MKFGKRSDSDDAAADPAGPSSDDPVASAPAEPLAPVPENPPPVAEHEVPPAPVAEYETPGSPAGEELPVAHVEPTVEGEAYEIPAEEPTAPPDTLTVHRHEPEPPPPPMSVPVAEQPISVVAPGPGPAPVTTLGDSGEAFASGHAAAPGPSWQEPVMGLANERPELAVGAAFVGGLLAAMILRRLGS